MFYSFVIAFIAGLALNLLFVPLGKGLSFLKSHGSGISKLGGPAIFGAFAIAAVIIAAHLSQEGIRLPIIALAFALIFLLGLIDDILDLSASKKLIVQFLIALILFLGGVKTQISVLPEWANALLTLFWLVAITNAFNLLDIQDGLASGIAIICSLTFWYIASATGNALASLLAASLLGANLAFLKFNFPPAKLYMGDSGSLFNGFSLAAIALIISYAPAGREAALFTPLLILALPLYDLLFVVIMRLISKRPITKKSKDHFVLRLITGGVSPQKAVFFMYALNCLFNLAAILLISTTRSWGILILSLAIFLWLAIAYKISRISVHEI
ncbi:MAG: MraY family glycosyltransferase [Candidatus Omnitrophota bacterium]|nr:MraY family glycosyltransferase [Candidatus Omnitrophota bacterium]